MTASRSHEGLWPTLDSPDRPVADQIGLDDFADPASSDLPYMDGHGPGSSSLAQELAPGFDTPSTLQPPTGTTDLPAMDPYGTPSDLRPDATDTPRAPEILEPPVLAYEQGINEFGFEGTCGPTTIANSLNSLFGGSEFSENSCVEAAIDHGLCNVDGEPAECGGTSTSQLVELYREVEPDRIEVERFDFENALSEEQIAQRLENGSVVNIAVDSKTLWGKDYGFDAFSDSVVSDHWIEVNGVERDSTGQIVGFNVVDSGGGTDYVEAGQFHAMYLGTPERMIADPTCIVVSRKA